MMIMIMIIIIIIMQYCIKRFIGEESILGIGNVLENLPIIKSPILNETPTVRGLAAEKNNKLYTETMIFLWNNHYNLKFNVTV